MKKTISKRNTTMISSDKVVYECLFCRTRFTDDKGRENKCPNCNKNTLVIDSTLLVLK